MDSPKSISESDILPGSRDSFDKSCLISTSYISEKTGLYDIEVQQDIKNKHNTSLILSFLQSSWKICLILLVAIVTSVIVATGRYGFEDEFVFELVNYEVTPPSTPVRAVERQSTPSPVNTGVLECFQVYQPVLTPDGPADQTIGNNGNSETAPLVTTAPPESCTVLLMEHVFVFSYGLPFVGAYTPPSCDFNRVIMNLTVTSKGRQYDRLAIMYLGDTEVFRTSTAEPTRNGIIYTYIKDMSEFMYFWKSPQTVIFDLGNLVNDVLTGTFNVTLTATFFKSDQLSEPAALILPVSGRNGAMNQPSVFQLPTQDANNSITLPRNVNRAVFTVSACGQQDEEFWWSNNFNSDLLTFGEAMLLGYSPFREVQVFIDGELAGVQWPFPILFTGAAVPSLWKPIVGIDAFDLREHEIDITPWLGVLCDGNPHVFEIKVAGIDDNGGTTGKITETVGNYWLVSGKIFLWLDDDSSITTGAKPTLSVPDPVIELSRSTTQNSTGSNATLSEQTSVKRTLSIESSIKTQHKTFLSKWSQSLSYSNNEKVTLIGLNTVTTFKISGLDVGTGAAEFKSEYEYPLYFNSSQYFKDNGDALVLADFDRGLSLSINTASVFPTGAQPYLHLPGMSSLTAGQLSDTSLQTTQKGTGQSFAYVSTNTSGTFATTSQHFAFTAQGSGSELYTRDVTAVNGSVTYDKEQLFEVIVRQNSFPVTSSLSEAGGLLVAQTPKQIVGKGPGEAKPNLVSNGQGGGGG